MSNWVDVELIGGPMDGSVQQMQHAAIYEDPDPGAYLVVDDDHKAPGGDPGARAVYEPDPPPADPRRWVWRGWIA
ncbi:hypothetical protein HNR23_002219 [Nocardiopsis mwathae]|uniref:Uncharacterized protein n=1 Tax=Nocardiopsis mwathae TaxID=1472723 RepID=A0A7X0D6I8_9ACTN|nr:hypothetical protein [Nocardiopsis mwathae]MBB6172159.1 hypothetical protein [Nocardiopsis mwathae]